MSYAEDLSKIAPQYFAWNVLAVANTGAAGMESNTIHKQLSGPEVNMIGVYPACEIVFNFSSSGGINCHETNDMVLPANTLTFITVPKAIREATHAAGRSLNAGGEGNIRHSNLAAKLGAVYFNHLSTTATQGAVRIVEC